MANIDPTKRAEVLDIKDMLRCLLLMKNLKLQLL